MRDKKLSLNWLDEAESESVSREKRKYDVGLVSLYSEDIVI